MWHSIDECLLPLIAPGNFTVPSSYLVVFLYTSFFAYAPASALTYAMKLAPSLALTVALTVALLQSYYQNQNQNQNQNYFQHQHVQAGAGPGGIDGEAVWFKRSMKCVTDTDTACLRYLSLFPDFLQFLFHIV